MAIPAAFGLKYNVRKYFFDREAVIRSVDRATLVSLRRAGGLTRKISRNSIGRLAPKAKVRPPGQPPRNRTDRLRDGIVFALEQATKSVIVGPRLYNQTDLQEGEWRSGVIPQILEFGGRIGILEQQVGPNGVWLRVDKRYRKNNNPKRIRVAQYQPHPYMNPALEKVLPKLPSIWEEAKQ